MVRSSSVVGDARVAPGAVVFGQCQHGVDAVPAPGPRTGVQGAAGGGDAFPHPQQTMTRTAGGHRGPRRGPVGAARPVVADAHVQPSRLLPPPQTDPGTGRARVLDRVGQGLLHDAVHRQVVPGGQRSRCPGHLEVDVQAGGAHGVDE
ncbi:hypothetical protein A7J05_04755 [Streptomyces alfalfae]|uniref:Uncharacterized protein n=1 Tax=Streptomyces alfalfae TaxID=1642299 RepID=A0ABM6GNA8_9ACTN|nr:hypothetical protein A7J05_04755 [Streptomyces alfalfae]AYA15475.1 hypothetical protein D3X13_03770 [Streptomyces fradiae]